MKCWKMEKEERNGHEVFWYFNQMANLIPTLFSHSFIELTFLPRVGLFHKWPSARSWSSINKVSIFISTFDVINLTLALREEIIKNWSNTTMMMIITFQLEFVQNFCRQRARARSKISYLFARQTTKNSQTRMGKWLTKNVWFNLFTFEKLYLKVR